jgi:flagellar protein FlbD
MIRLTRINHVPLVLNSDLIEHIEITPDTVISMTTGTKFIVLESPADVVRQVIEFRRSLCATPWSPPVIAPASRGDGPEEFEAVDE